jgi:signal transduction histidine kinase
MLRTFRAKLLVSLLALVLSVLALVVVMLDVTLGRDLSQRLDQRLEQQARGAAQWGVGEGRRHPEKIAARLSAVVGADVTLFDRDGNVLGDSREDVPPPGGAHEPEVQIALAHEVGRAARVERGEEMHFVAVRAADGSIVRLSAPLSEINETVERTRERLLVAAVAGSLAALALAWFFSRVAARPLRVMTSAAERIAAGDYDVPVASDAPDEFGTLSRALASLARQLDQRIADLTRERTHVHKLLAVGRDFMANASHELRTPVTAIEGGAETLLHAEHDAETRREFLESIHRHARRLAKLVDDMLKLSSIEQRPSELRIRERVDVAGVAGLVAETLEPRAASHGTRVVVDVPAGLGILGDPGVFEQVLENLVDNAIKYGRSGGSVAIEATAGSARRVNVRVRDDGPGIGAEHIPRLFERFYRVDQGRSREQGGTGLGLAIVKQFVESMGGEVRVTSQVGVGTTFHLELPAALPGDSDGEQRDPSSTPTARA